MRGLGTCGKLELNCSDSIQPFQLLTVFAPFSLCVHWAIYWGFPVPVPLAGVWLQTRAEGTQCGAVSRLPVLTASAVLLQLTACVRKRLGTACSQQIS